MPEFKTIMARCEICGREEKSLFKVRHKKRGKIKICDGCRQSEAKNLLAASGCDCC